MITLEPFDYKDLQKIEYQFRLARNSMFPASIIFLCFSLFCGIKGHEENNKTVWTWTWQYFVVIFSLLMLLMAVSYLRLSAHYKKDKALQLKFSGTIRVVNKFSRRADGCIYTGDKTLKKINIGINVYKKISTDDIIFIQLSKFGKVVLRLEKNGVDLLP